MKESDIEGVANHDGPESCAGARKDVVEALTGVRAGWAIEPRNQGCEGADAVNWAGRQHRCQRYCKQAVGPARSKNLCMHGISMRENREILWSPAARYLAAGRKGKAKAVIPR